MTKLLYVFLLVMLSNFVFVLGQDSESKETKKEDSNAATESTPKATESKNIKKLEKEMIYESKESLLRIPGSGTLIEEKELEKFEYNDIHRVLFKVPGVYFREEDGYGLRPNIGIRGANSDRSSKVTIMEDDVLLGPAPYSAPAAYYFPMVTRMTNVSVIKGPAGIIYGPNTIGGAVQLKTRDIPRKGQGQLDLSVGLDQFLKGHVYFGNSIGSFGFLGEFVHESTDGFKELDGGGDTGFVKNEGMVKLGYVLDKNLDFFQQFEFKLGYSSEISDETYLGLTDEDFSKSSVRRYVASELDKMEWERTQIVGKYVLGIGDNIIIKNSIYRHDFSRKWNKFNRFKNGPSVINILENPSRGQEAVYYAILTGDQDSANDGQKLQVGLNDRNFVAQGVQSDLEWELQGDKVKHRVSFGLRLHYDEIERNHTERSYNMQNGHLVSDGSAKTLNTLEEASSLAFAGYLKYELEWNRLKIIPGFRYEKIFSKLDNQLTNNQIENDQYAFVPGIGSFYSFTESFGILGGIHKGFSPIAPGQTGGVEQEKSINYELGLRLTKETFSVEVIGFYNDYSNLTGIGSFSSGATDVELDRQFNAGSVGIFGLELNFYKEFQINDRYKLPLQLVYSFTDSEIKSNFESDDPQIGVVKKGDRLPYIPEHQLNFSIGIEHKKWGVSANFKYLSSMKELAGSGSALEGKETDDYFITDLAGFYSFNEKHKLYANIDNLFDTEYIVSRRPFGARPGMPFHATLGYKFSF